LPIGEIGGSRAQGRTVGGGSPRLHKPLFSARKLGETHRAAKLYPCVARGAAPLSVWSFWIGVFPRKGSLPDGRDYRLGERQRV